MNIHEHQAKQLLKKYGASVPKGVFAFTTLTSQTCSDKSLNIFSFIY